MLSLSKHLAAAFPIWATGPLECVFSLPQDAIKESSLRAGCSAAVRGRPATLPDDIRWLVGQVLSLPCVGSNLLYGHSPCRLPP